MRKKKAFLRKESRFDKKKEHQKEVFFSLYDTKLVVLSKLAGDKSNRFEGGFLFVRQQEKNKKIAFRISQTHI